MQVVVGIAHEEEVWGECPGRSPFRGLARAVGVLDRGLGTRDAHPVAMPVGPGPPLLGPHVIKKPEIERGLLEEKLVVAGREPLGVALTLGVFAREAREVRLVVVVDGRQLDAVPPRAAEPPVLAGELRRDIGLRRIPRSLVGGIHDGVLANHEVRGKILQGPHDITHPVPLDPLATPEVQDHDIQPKDAGLEFRGKIVRRANLHPEQARKRGTAGSGRGCGSEKGEQQSDRCRKRAQSLHKNCSPLPVNDSTGLDTDYSQHDISSIEACY